MSAAGVYGLVGGLLPEMARGLGYDGLGDAPDEDALRGFITHVGPAKTLQDNIALVQQRLGRADDAVAIAAGWVERSGALRPLNRSFLNPELFTPDAVDVALCTGGVARWMLRRTGQLEQYVVDGGRVGRVVLASGNRIMRAAEHELVERYASRYGGEPTEADFMAEYIEPRLRAGGMNVQLARVESANGGDVMARAAADARLADGIALVAGNAPGAVQTAGQLRQVGREIQPGYDDNGEQLYVVSDTIAVARQGESPATHQNPLTALGQIARNALILHQQAR